MNLYWLEMICGRFRIYLVLTKFWYLCSSGPNQVWKCSTGPEYLMGYIDFELSKGWHYLCISHSYKETPPLVCKMRNADHWRTVCNLQIDYQVRTDMSSCSDVSMTNRNAWFANHAENWRYFFFQFWLNLLSKCLRKQVEYTPLPNVSICKHFATPSPPEKCLRNLRTAP